MTEKPECSACKGTRVLWVEMFGWKRKIGCPACASAYKPHYRREYGPDGMERSVRDGWIIRDAPRD